MTGLLSHTHAYYWTVHFHNQDMCTCTILWICADTLSNISSLGNSNYIWLKVVHEGKSVHVLYMIEFWYVCLLVRLAIDSDKFLAFTVSHVVGEGCKINLDEIEHFVNIF